MSTQTSGLPVYVWSNGRVLLLDPRGGEPKSGATIRDVKPDAQARSGIVLIAHRSSIVRRVGVPNLRGQEMNALVESKVSSLLPAGANGYVLGYRLSKDLDSPGKIATVGAVKADSLRILLAQAKEANLQILHIVPAPFASWLAAHNRGLRNGMVITREGSDLCLDVVVDGELRYSRFCAEPPSQADVVAEIERTYATAGAMAGVTLCVGGVSVPGCESENSGIDRFVQDPGQISSLLFSLELAEQKRTRDRRKVRGAAQRALVVAVLAIAAWGYDLYTRSIEDEKLAEAQTIQTSLARGESQRLHSAADAKSRLGKTANLIDLAFDPAQNFGDVVAVLGRDSNDKSWLTGLSLERGRPMTVRGQAKDLKTVSSFVAKLSGEPRFRDTKLLFAHKGQLHNTPVVQFAISAVLVGNVPFDQEVSPGVKGEKKN